MSQPRQQTRKPSGWRGARTTAQKTHVAHKWEVGARRTAADGGRPPTGRVGRRIATLTALALLLLGWFVWSILFAPPQTPVVLITMDTPHADLPPNGWVREDFERLELLHDQTLQVVDSSPEWHSRADGLRDLEQRLTGLAEHARRGTAVVIYLSIHGAVRDDGVPCLLAVAPGVSPLDTTAWVPVTELLHRVERAGFPDDVCKLVVFDCGRMRVNWSAGVLYNTFADRLEDAVADVSIPNLVVVNATSPGEKAWDSDDLRGSVFAYFFQEGIAGAADDRAEGGNGNRKVSLPELLEFVQSRVDSWVRFNRGERQRPMVVAADVPDVDVAWALRRSTRARLSQAARDIGRTQASDETELLQAWQQYDSLRSQDVATAQPLAVARLLRSLQQFEDAMSAGQAYAPVTVAARANVEHQLSLLEAGPFAGGHAAGLGTVRFQTARSIPMAREFQSSAPESITRASALLETFTGDTGDASLTTGLQSLEGGPNLRRFVEVHFLRLLEYYGIHDPSTVREALSTRVLAERAATPHDERVFAVRDPEQTELWTSVNNADALRLAREDDLFAGISVSADDWEQIRSAYSHISADSGDRSAALSARDRILAELPYLAGWLCRVSGDAEQQAEADAAVAGTLRDVITSIYPVRDDDLLLHVTAQRLETDFGELQALFDREYARLLRPEDATGERIRDALSLLSCPVLPSASVANGGPVEQRMALRSRVRAMASERNAQWQAGQTDSKGDVAAEDRVPFLQRIETEWGGHPLDLMLSDKDRPTVEGDLLARHGRREQFVRLRLATIPLQFQPPPVTDGEQPSPPSSREVRDRTHWSNAERLARIVAPLALEPFDLDPVFELRRRDVGQLMLWQAQRALTDCYGPAAEDEAPFVIDAASAYLAAARELTEQRSLASARGADLQQQLQDLTVAAQQGFDLAASDVILIDDQGETSVVARRGPGADAFPEGGRAAVFLGVPAAATGPAPTIPIPLDAGGAQLRRLPIPAEMATDTRNAQQALLLFRGHRFPAAFRVTPLAGTRSTFHPGHPDNADVTVLGPQRNHPQVVFVLDCSASMQQPVSLEAAPSRRFDVARLALELLMRELAVNEEFRVGMVLFGHRARWDQEDRTLVRPQVSYGRPIPSGQMPYDDVETVLPLGRFDSSIAANLFDQLDTTMPWGESPLYAALLEAIRQFPADDRAGEPFIVVVTDGLNHQFGAPAGKVKQAANVLQALGNRPVTMNVVGFDVPPEEAAEAQRVYNSLTQSAGGRYTPIDESGSLIDYLRSLFSQEQFRVDSARRTPQFADVGTPLHVRSLVPAGESVRVTATEAETSVSLEGGEAVRLLLSPDGMRLTSEPYLNGNPRFVPLVGGGNAQTLTLGVHRPIRRSDVVEFEFSIQSSDGSLTPRPGIVWIELTPVSATGARGKPYTFYDRSFADRTSVPVLTWAAENWPDDATRAEARFWCRFETVAPDVDEPIGDPGGGPAHLTGPAGAALTITRDAGGIVVVEQYREAPAEFPGVRIDLGGPAPVSEVVREFDRDHSAVIHRFLLTAGSDDARLQVTRRDRVASGAWQLTTPVLVDVAVSDGLILPPPP